MDRFVNIALLKEPINWVIVPVVIILAGMALAYLLPEKGDTPVQDTGGRR